MRIKRVVIQGFKTFAAKTEFIFDPGITALVGPNGSGKSNVVDAVRWCLGEQSFSLLRSKKTSDVIFAGSDKRARLGMAEVRLTLDNGDGELPIDFSEIEITRRAYRDGDNEYLLNGQRVRLQDITELLAQTGLGKRTYAVIGQGLIDKVLSLSPEERRSLFEEAAGITGYQAKRARTVRQLDATQQNLTRVHDILAELNPRLTYLHRQAERAREREQLAADLHDLLRQWYGYCWHTTLHQLHEQQTAEQELHRQMDALQTELAAQEQRIEGLRQQQMVQRETLGQLHSESSALHEQAEKIGRELAVAQERARQIDVRREETQRELTPLRLQVDTLQARLAELDDALAASEAIYAERQQAVQTLQAEVDQRQQERAQRQQAVDAAQNARDAVRNQLAEARSRLDQLAERDAELRDEHARQTAAHARATEEAAELTRALHAAEDELQQQEQQIATQRNALHETESAAARIQEQIQRAEAERQAANRTLDQLQTRRDLLQRLRHEGAGYASGVRAVLGAREELDGILGTVATLIHVPAALDKAIETALGGAFQNIVTQHWDDAQRAIELLKRTGRGRATFLPLDRLHTLPRIPAPAADGIRGNAADLVDYDPALAKVATSLLGRVWVADDLAAARRALDALRRGPRPTVVTVGGEIVRPGGAVTGGRDSNRRDDSVLAREREYRELPAQIAAATEQSQQTSVRCRALNAKLEETRSTITTQQQILDDLTHAEQQAHQHAAEIRRQLDRAQQTVQWYGERLQQIDAERAALTTQKADRQAAVQQLQAQQQTAEAQLAEAAAELDNAGANARLEQLADLRAAAAEAQGQVQSQQALRANHARTRQDAQQQIQAKEQRIQSLEREATALRQQIDTISQHESELRQRINAYQREIEPREVQLASWQSQQAEAEAAERKTQQTLRQVEQGWNTAKLKLQRTEDALEQLQHDIEHDFGLVQLEESDEHAYQPPLPLETIVEALPVVTAIPPELEDEVKTLRTRLNRASNVNPEAPREYAEAAERHEFLLSQSADLEEASADLRAIIEELDELMENELDRTFQAVMEQFGHYFARLFDGGSAKLVLTDPEDLTNTGIEIIARPPGKRPQSLALLSGGERALSACALIFSVLHVSPTPFCVLDEVDAALDEANVDRFRQTVESLTEHTQFIIVTHNRRTLEGAHTIYGITMGDDGVSQTIGLRLDGDEMIEKGAANEAQDPQAVDM